MQLHGRQQRLGDIEESRQRDVDHAVPVVLGHQCHDVVATDAGIVDDNLDVLAIMTSLPLIQRLVRLLAVAHVEGQQFAVAPRHFQRPTGFGLVAGVIDYHLVALLCQADTNGPSYASATAGY